MSLLKWTTKNVAHLKQTLQQMGHKWPIPPSAGSYAHETTPYLFHKS